MSNLSIDNIKVTDNISDINKACNITLVPTEFVTAPAGEFAYPGDTTRLAGTQLRPNGAQLDVVTGYGGVPAHSVFNGSIEFMDDLEDPDQNTFTIMLSNAPISQAHRTKFSLITGMVVKPTTPGEWTTTHKLLQRLCDRVGIPLGRIDLPNCNVWGNYEVRRASVVEVAQELAGAFNNFDFVHYFTRIDEINGLQIIKVDYTLGGEVTNSYELENVTTRTRTYEKYMCDNRIGSSLVVILGADYYGIPKTNLPTNVVGLTPIDDDTEAPIGETKANQALINAHHTSKSSSNSEDYREDPSSAWSETEETTEYIVRISYGGTTEEVQAGLDEQKAARQADTYPGTPPDLGNIDLDDLNALMLSGVIDSAEVVSSFPQHKMTSNYDDVEGPALQSTAETFYEYETKYFIQTVDQQNKTPQIVLISEYTINDAYPDGQKLEVTQDLVEYLYDDFGNQAETATKHYRYEPRGEWVLETVSVTTAASNTPIGIGPRPDSGVTPITSQIQILPGGAPSEKQVPQLLGRYMLFNGLPTSVNGEMTMMKPHGTAGSATYEDMPVGAFEVSVAYMDQHGLTLINEQVNRQKDLEKGNYYWEVVKATASLDTTPVAGESLVVAGSSGIVDLVEHNIDGDSGLTTVTLRRLVNNV